MTIAPLFFLKHIEKKYALKLNGKKSLALILPKAKIKQASFIWNEKVELMGGDFEVEVDPFLWLQSGIWSMRLKGDGARLRFLGDWLKKTGVSEVETTRLRLALQFSNDGIQDIDTVDLVSPNYQLQIHSREVQSLKSSGHNSKIASLPAVARNDLSLRGGEDDEAILDSASPKNILTAHANNTHET